MSITKYLVAPYKISIITDKLERPYYNVEPILKLDSYNLLLYKIEQQILKEKGSLDSEILKLDEIINYLTNFVRRFIKHSNFNLDPKKEGYLVDWLVFRLLNMEKIMPILIDDFVQEIYLDKPESNLYIDHQNFGRCKTNIFLQKEELEIIKTRLCLEKNLVLNLLNPSIKAEIETSKFHIRAAIDIPPLASDGLSMNIRKLRKKIWTLPELISNNMLSIEATSYILFILKRRNNFTIIGEPGSGKTTLANSIDLLTPPNWRKITIEDVIESIEQSKFDKFQTRYSVSSFENKLSYSSKSEEIIKLLHRSPTWVFLGEIQTAEHSKALFEALSAGLIGIQTCHGQSIELMFIRWLNQHQIPISSIFSLDLLIETHSDISNWRIKRYVNRIAEISKKQIFSKKVLDISDFDLINIFKFNAHTNSLECCVDLFETPILEKIKINEKISRDEFNTEFNLIKSILSNLIINKIYDPKIAITTFEKFHLKTLDLHSSDPIISK